MLKKDETVGIIGAGPAGLSAAYFLQEAGIACKVFEASSTPGGLASAVNLYGRQLDLGPHTFLESSQPQAVQLWKALGGHHLQNLTLNRGMVLQKKMIPFPPQPFGLLRSLGPIHCSRASASNLISKLSSKKPAMTAGDFFSNKFGQVFNQLVFDPFCEKYMGTGSGNVDPGFAGALSSFAHQSGKTDIQANPVTMKNLLYPEDGTAAQWKRLAEKLGRFAPIHLNKKVSAIQTNDSKLSTVYFEDGTHEQVKYLVSSLPIKTILNLLGTGPEEVKKSAALTATRNTILVYLRLEKTRFPQHYITVFDHSLEAGRISNFDNWQPRKQFDDTVICMEYWCDSHEPIWHLEESEMIRKAMQELVSAGLARKNAFRDGVVKKIAQSHPILDLHYQLKLKEINTYLDSFANLSRIGRHATFSWDGQADNIMAGMRVAEEVKRYLTHR